MVSETSLLTEFMAEVVLESGLCRKLFSFDVETYTACGEDLVKRVLAAKIPVSYTHLDVYKRQF